MEYQRFDWHQRIQHWAMMLSFLMCTFSGVPIKFSHFPLAIEIANIFGGFDNMFRFHLVGAAIMLSCSAYHVLYLPFTFITRKWSTAMLPAKSDFINLADNISYFMGKRENPAKFDRYTYFEKFDYWAVFWGMVMIGLSGLMMSFPDVSARYVPRWIIDIARVAHSDEAVLAIMVIFVWHFYNVHLNPKFFPMNESWLNGKMPLEHFKYEHPAEFERLIVNIANNNDEKSNRGVAL